MEWKGGVIPKITGLVFAIAILLITLPSVAGSGEREAGIQKVFVPLFNRLMEDGFQKDGLRSLFSDKRLEFMPRALEINIKYVEKPEHYRKFMGAAYVKLGREFMNRHSGFMSKIEKNLEVPGEIITAILLIETKLGQKRGNYRVFSVLATVATADSEDNIEANFKRLKTRFPDLKKEDVVRRAKSRSRWAFGELKSLLRMAEKEGLDPLEIKGSWAGAFGIPQFIPSSFLAYGIDGNADGKKDLDNLYDAIASVANYLRKHGWRPGLSHEQKRKVIWKYNHSELYVDTVLASAKLIADTRDKR
jgi:membrane-bound lytic murein transglycosylase B